MSELTLILDRKELVVRLENKAIRIDRPDCKPERVPIVMIEKVIVIGSPFVSCDVWRVLAQNNIHTVILPARGTGDAAYISGGLNGTVKNRIAQYTAFKDKKTSLAIAIWLISKKISGQEKVIQILGVNGTGVFNHSTQFNEYQQELKKSDTREKIMGHEGVSAATYFGIWKDALPKKWKFKGRNRRPPKDPVNALLSLSYVLAGSNVKHSIQMKGLDPALGFLHSMQQGRESLVLDIIEPIRPIIDKFVLQIIKKKLTLKNFTTNEQDGCLLNKKGRKIFFQNWAYWTKTGAEGKSLQQTANDIVNKVVDFFPRSECLSGEKVC